MRKSFAIVLLALAMAAGAGTAQAAIIFHAILTGSQETPPVPDEGSGGVGIFILNDAMTELSYDIRLFGLDLRGVDPATGASGLPIPGDLNPDDNVTRTHIHRAPVAVAGPIVFGQIDASPALRNDSDDLVIDVAGLHITGVWDLGEGAAGATLATELDNLLNYRLYFNVHTSDHGPGEIRGQIIPEPGSLALLGIGTLGLIGFALRRRRA